MDKNSIMIILKDYLEEDDDNCAILHFNDGSELLIYNVPTFFNLIMSVKVYREFGEDKIEEKIHIPYSSIIYITTSNSNNLKIAYYYQYNIMQKE